MSGGRAASSNQIRLLLVEDVPQVAQYVRGLLNVQGHVKLLDVLTDASDLARQVDQLRPDMLIIDSLLQGKVKGAARAAVVLNAGAAIYLAGDAETVVDGVAIAENALQAGAGHECLERLRAATAER